MNRGISFPPSAFILHPFLSEQADFSVAAVNGGFEALFVAGVAVDGVLFFLEIDGHGQARWAGLALGPEAAVFFDEGFGAVLLFGAVAEFFGFGVFEFLTGEWGGAFEFTALGVGEGCVVKLLGASEAAESPRRGDDAVGEDFFFVGLRGDFLEEFGAVLFEFIRVLAFDEEVVGVDPVLDRVLRDDRLAFGRCGPGGFLGIAAIGFELLE